MPKQLNIAKYGESEHGNFAVIDTIGVPHPYCIGARHVTHASDRYAGILGGAAIESAEKKGIYCEVCEGRLSYKEHKIALLVECRAPTTDSSGSAVPELHDYLLKVKEQCERDGYAGFAFVGRDNE